VDVIDFSWKGVQTITLMGGQRMDLCVCVCVRVRVRVLETEQQETGHSHLNHAAGRSERQPSLMCCYRCGRWSELTSLYTIFNLHGEVLYHEIIRKMKLTKLTYSLKESLQAFYVRVVFKSIFP